MSIKPVLYSIFLFTTLLFSQENVEVIAQLPEPLSETSGLLFYKGKLITHNDSGNTPQLFEIDTVSYEVSRTITVTNVENKDWEDLAQDDQYIYIGDFGNNLGTRRDLSIYRISKEAYDQSDTVTAEIIAFTYEDQTNFIDNGTSDWDAEAFFVLDDQLIILTKQWKSEGTVAYSLSKDIGVHLARSIETYPIDGLVTGASYNPENKTLLIIGYSSTLLPFTVKILNSTPTSIFTDNIERTNLSIGFAQVESITYVDDNTYFLSSEFFERTNPSIILTAQLFKFDLVESEPKPEPDNKEINIFQRSGYKQVEYNLNTEEQLLGRAIYDTSGRRLLYTLGTDIDDETIDLSALQNSVYYLTFYFNNRTESIPFIRY